MKERPPHAIHSQFFDVRFRLHDEAGFQLPGLGFLQNYCSTAKSMKYQFGDHAEDYEVYLNAVGQEVIGDVKGCRGMHAQRRMQPRAKEARTMSMTITNTTRKTTLTQRLSSGRRLSDQ